MCEERSEVKYTRKQEKISDQFWSLDSYSLEQSTTFRSFDYEMPARRRFAGSESDDNFSVLIDSGDGVITSDHNQSKLAEDPYSGDEKKKYANPRSNFYGVGSFSVPTGITKWSSSIGSFLHQQIVQAGNVNVEQLFFENNPTSEKQFAAESVINNSVNDSDEFDSDKSEIVIMASRDRTGEFFNAIRSMQGRNIARAVNIKDPRKATQLQSYSEFMMAAKLIGKNIASTYSKLEKLTLRKYTLQICLLQFL